MGVKSCGCGFVTCAPMDSADRPIISKATHLQSHFLPRRFLVIFTEMASPLRHGTGFNSAEVATDAAASKARTSPFFFFFSFWWRVGVITCLPMLVASQRIVDHHHLPATHFVASAIVEPGLFSRGAYFKHSVFVSLCAADRDFADPELVALGSALAGLDLVSADAITLLYGGAGADAASAGPDPDGGGGTDGGRDDPPVHAVFVAPDLWASVGGTEVYDMDRFVDIPFGGKAAAAAEGSGDDPPELAFPATDLDLMLYVKGASLDACFAVARAQVASIAGAAPSAAFSASYLNGFVHRGGRDLSGFVDGTRYVALLSSVARATAGVVAEFGLFRATPPLAPTPPTPGTLTTRSTACRQRW